MSSSVIRLETSARENERGWSLRRYRTAKTLLAVLATFLFSSIAQAQLEWRLSVKFILDSNGSLTVSGVNINVNSPQIVTNQLVTINQILDGLGRGYRLRLDQMVLLSGVSQWFNYDATKANKSTFEAAAIADPTTYAWRTNAINVYICGTAGTNSGGLCSFPGTGQNSILVAQNSFSDVIIHESGHFFSLLHTHDSESFKNSNGTACSTNDCTCAQFIGGDDGMADTPLDHQCWTQDQVAQNTYGQVYAVLNSGQQYFVDNTWSNIMSYHQVQVGTGLNRFTPDQLDAMTDNSNGARFNVATGKTRFVSTTGSDSSGDGSSTSQYRTLNKGVTVAVNGDIVLLRGDNYNEQPTIVKPVTLRATRGTATIGKP